MVDPDYPRNQTTEWKIRCTDNIQISSLNAKEQLLNLKILSLTAYDEDYYYYYYYYYFFSGKC